MTGTGSHVCPCCHRRLAKPGTAGYPFCSERCQLADLQKWFGEQYRIPVTEEAADETEETPRESPSTSPIEE